MAVSVEDGRDTGSESDVYNVHDTWFEFLRTAVVGGFERYQAVRYILCGRVARKPTGLVVFSDSCTCGHPPDDDHVVSFHQITICALQLPS